MRYGQLLLQLAYQLQLKYLLVLKRIEGALKQGQILERGLRICTPGECSRCKLRNCNFGVLQCLEGNVARASCRRCEHPARRASLDKIVIIFNILTTSHLFTRALLVVRGFEVLVDGLLLVLLHRQLLAFIFVLLV